MKLDNFIEDLASESPAPGGGATSALFGVLGASLSSMVCALTKGKSTYSQYEEFVSVQYEKLLLLQKKLEALIQADTDAFMQISAAFKLPKDNEEQKSARSKAIQEAMIPATQTPFDIMKFASCGLDITDSLIGKTNVQAISDLGCAALGFKSAIQGAYLNVRINLASTKSPKAEFVDGSKQIIEKYIPLADDIYKKVLEKL